MENLTKHIIKVNYTFESPHESGEVIRVWDFLKIPDDNKPKTFIKFIMAFAAQMGIDPHSFMDAYEDYIEEILIDDGTEYAEDGETAVASPNYPEEEKLTGKIAKKSAMKQVMDFESFKKQFNDSESFQKRVFDVFSNWLIGDVNV